MKIKFKQKYKSISNFAETEIKDFSVFLGVNGSGKTHILKALRENFVVADNILEDRISYFNFQTFLIKNQKPVAPRNLEDEKMEAWNVLNAQKQSFQNFDNQIKTIVGDEKYPYRAKVSKEHEDLYESHKKQLLDFIDNNTRRNPKTRKLLKTGVFDSEKYASEMSQNDFFKFSSYNPDDYELLESLSEIFIDYQRRQVIAGLPKKDGGEELSEKEISAREKQSPWNFVNHMFDEFNLPHRVTCPEFNASYLIQNFSSSFQVKLAINDEEIDFEDLSSGEKILCSLAITMYQDNQSSFPELLLLDEVDASLHPSMVQNLLDVINNVFVKNGCKVILATHSPTTVALAPEESLFEIQKGIIADKIRKVSQSNAIELLSEGIITYEKGLKIQTAVDSTKDLQIITEGNNAQHIKKAFEILNVSLLEKIKIIEDGGGQQLKNAFDVFSSAEHTSTFLFVWDCDFEDKVVEIEETENFKKFCFEENASNTKSRDKNNNAVGIENLYPDSLFTEDVYSTREIPGSYGATSKIMEFDKQKFLQKIQEQTNKTYFKKFQPLVDLVSSIIE